MTYQFLADIYQGDRNSDINLEEYNRNYCIYTVDDNTWEVFKLADFIIVPKPQIDNCIICRDPLEEEKNVISLTIFGCCELSLHHSCLLEWHKFKLNEFYGKSSDEYYIFNGKAIRFINMFKCPYCCQERKLTKKQQRFLGTKKFMDELENQVKTNYKPPDDDLGIPDVFL